MKEAVKELDYAARPMKRRWFKSSVNIGFYLGQEVIESNELQKILKNYLSLLHKENYSVYLLCENFKVADYIKDQLKLDYAIMICPIRNARRLITLLSNYDINLVHLIPKKHLKFWQLFIRQVVALNLYAPPLIVGFQNSFNKANDLIDQYMQEFENYHTGECREIPS